MVTPVKEPAASNCALPSRTVSCDQSLADPTPDVAPQGSWELDAHASDFRGSEDFFRIFDLQAEKNSLPFRQVMDAIAGADRERVENTIHNAFRTRDPFDVEHRIARRDGSYRVLRSLGQIVGGVNQPARLVGSTVDITDGRMAHVRLRESEEKFRSLVANLPDVTWSSSVDGRLLYISPNVENILGFSAEEKFEQGTWLGRVHPNDAERVVEAFRRLFTDSTPFDVEYRIQRKDGQWIWINDRAYRTYEKDGVRCADGIFSDITERRRAEEIRERLATLVDSSNDAILGKTVDGTITAWNPGAERLFGYSASEAVGHSLAMLILADRENEESDILARIRKGERVEHFETVRVRKGGRRVDVSVTISPIRDSRGQIVGAAKIARDITERKRAEEAMREAKEAAEAANLAKSQFLANMSHEIRTPMNGIIGAAGLLLETELTAEQRRYGDIVRMSGEALLEVINDILDFSKIEARKMSLATADFDLASVLNEATNVLSIKASEKALPLNCEIAPGTPVLLRGDSGRLRQILINLIGNAVKFTTEGEVSIRAAVETEDERQARLRFTVRDTGIGFRQERAAALFEPFVQADGSSTRRYGGTGLGLAISKELVELMGGQIGAESEEGKGSTFWFTAVFEKQARAGLPTRAHSAEFASAAKTIVSSASYPAAKGQSGQILVAEDNSINRQVLVAMLDKLGYKVDAVENGAEAIRSLHDRAYDLVLMDCMMPQMDGYEATRRIRNMPAETRNPHIPIIAVTADAMSRDRDKCLAAGMIDYISKPVDVRQLAEVLRKWLSRPSSDGHDGAAENLPARAAVVFNQLEFLARLMGDQPLAGKVVAGFLSDAPKQLFALKSKLEAGDVDGAKLLAHTLKGAAATMSAEALRDLCAEAQEALAAGKLDSASELVMQLHPQFELLRTALQEWGWV